MSTETSGRPAGLPAIDVTEYGGKKDGERQAMNRRLFMQLLVYDCPTGGDIERHTLALIGAMEEAELPGVVYEDVNAPNAIALLTWSEDPAHFVKRVRPLFRREGLRELVQRGDHTMIGRSYSHGHEPDLEHALLRRFVENVTTAEWPWAVWYPLRRSGAFSQLERSEQGAILREHASIGMAYGRQDLAHDVRLACHGIDPQDNEFVLGLVGTDLHPLSHLVQRMRSTKQTAGYISKMGPFFVGYARWQSRSGAA